MAEQSAAPSCVWSELRVRRPRNQREVGLGDLEESSAEGHSPVLLVGEEAQHIDQRTDRRLIGGEKIESPPPRVKCGRHLGLMRLVIRHATKCGEGLQRLAAVERSLWRIENDEVAALQLLQSGWTTVIGLREAAGDSALYVIA